jgi:hypothetical protein
LRKIEAPGGAHRRRRAAAQFRWNPAWSGDSRSPSVDKGIEGEEARCTGMGERKGQKEGRAATDAFYHGSVVWAERKGGRGSGVGAACRA